LLLCLAAGALPVARAIFARRIDAHLAQAYTRFRPFDLRLPDAGYGAVRNERGSNRSEDGVWMMRRVESEIARWAGDGAEAWRKRGESALLEGSPDKAVQALSRARDETPDDEATVLALAAAYAVRGDTLGRAVDYANALDLVSARIKSGRASPVALFNRALIRERLLMYPEAAEDWHAYLDKDHESNWADEARRRLSADVERVRVRQDLREQIGQDPPQFSLQGVAVHADDYLEKTAIQWLANGSHEDATATSERLATVLRERYGDLWLADALQERGSTGAYDQLLRLVELNNHGETDDALKAADTLIGQFGTGRWTPAAARARVERVYALHRALRPAECLTEARALDGKLQRAGYQWMAIVNRTEIAICESMQGQEADSIRVYDQLMRESQKAGFLSLRLRAAGLLADAKTLAGESWAPWSECLPNLGAYWTSGVSPSRAHQIYFTMASAASQLGLRYAAVELAEAALRQLATLGNDATQALGEAGAARMAAAAGLKQEAAQWFDRAVESGRKAGRSETFERYRWEAELYRIQAALDSGDVDEAGRRFSGLDAVSAGGPASFALQLRKQVLNGEVALRSAEFSSAERELSAALQATNRRLASLGKAQRADALEVASQCVKSLMEALIAEGKASQALQVWLRFRSETGAAEKVEFRDGETWLVYAVLGKSIAAWRADSKSVKFQWLTATPAQVSRDARLLLDRVSDRDTGSDSIFEASSRLYDEVAAPLADGLDDRTALIVMAEGTLEAPFGLLMNRNHQLLMDTHVMMQSGGFSRHALERGVFTQRNKVLAVAVGHPANMDSESFAPLATAAREAQDTAARFTSATLLTDESTNLARIRSVANSVDLFHFSGHGFSNAGNGGLMLTDSVFGADQISAIGWRQLRLAVLSSCLTATGESRGPVNPNSLVRAFLTAGAKNVVAARWDIDSEATERLMKAFYDALLAGDSVAGALRSAKQKIRSLPGYAHPYYWGAFQVFE
jgi:CHAT domain-containing protein